MLGTPCGLTPGEEKLFRILLLVLMEKITFALAVFPSITWRRALQLNQCDHLRKSEPGEMCESEIRRLVYCSFGVTHLLLSFTKKSLFIKQKLKEGNREFALAKFLIMKEGSVYSEILRLPLFL